MSCASHVRSFDLSGRWSFVSQFPLSSSPRSLPHIQDQLKGQNSRWWCHPPSIPSSHFLFCHWCLFLSLTTPHPLPHLHSPSPLPQAMAAQASSLGCFKPFFVLFFLLQQLGGRGSFSIVVCCMLALSSSSPLCWRVGGGGGGVKPAYAPSLQPLSSVNPHCLVILFELTWMLLFGFGACGSFFFFFFLITYMFFQSSVQKACFPVFNRK